MLEQERPDALTALFRIDGKDLEPVGAQCDDAEELPASSLGDPELVMDEALAHPASGHVIIRRSGRTDHARLALGSDV
jgi:hypothetical protein